MSKSVAVLIYGQPRFLESGIAWRAAYWEKIKETYPDLNVDYYYHLWDGVEYSPIVEYEGNEDWAACNDAKRKSYYFDAPWTSFVNDIPVEPMVIQIHELHEKYNINAPKFFNDRSEMYRAKMDFKLRNSVSLRALRSFQAISDDKTRTIDFVTMVEDQYNLWAGLLSAPLYSMGKVYDLYSQLRKKDYDLIVMTRSDAVIDPYSANGMLDILEKEDPFTFPWEDNFFILEQPEMAYFNKVGVRTEDYTYLFCQKTIDIVFQNWYEKLHDMIMIESFKHFLHSKVIIQNLTQNIYSTHNVVFEMTRVLREGGPVIHFRRQYGALDNQAIIRTGAEKLKPSAENFKLLKDNMDKAQAIRLKLLK